MFTKINNFIGKYSYNDAIKKYLLEINRNKILINNFDDDKLELFIKITLPYIVEKFIVYGKDNGKQTIQPNAIIKIFNMQEEIMKEDLSYEELILNLDKEQVRFQDNNQDQLIYRYINLFQNDITSEKIINHILKMGLKQFIHLSLALDSFVRNFKKVEICLDKNKFRNFILNKKFNFSEKDISCFLEYISISKKDFKTKYEHLRKDDYDIKNDLLSNVKLSKNDKSLPKVSFYYPLIKDRSKYYFSSYIAVSEFLKFERLFHEISENKDIDEKYKSDIFGKKLIEDYTKKQARIFQEKNKNINCKVYGGEDYNQGKKKLSEPDVIVETEKFIIFIECKNSFCHLIKSLHDFDKNKDSIKTRISKDLTTSETNINNYIKNRNIDKNKIIYKFLMYFNATPVSISSFKFDIFDNSNFILTDISSIELLFRVEEDLDVVLKKYKQKNGYSIYDFIKYNNIKKDTSDFKKYLDFNN